MDGKPSLHQAMKEAVNHYISAEGIKCEVESSEIKEYIHRKYGIDTNNIIPSDYCYNRINKGTPLSHPVYLEYIEHNRYRCLGEGFPYDGQIKHKAKKKKEEIVGVCKQGKRTLFNEKEFYNK